MITNLPVKRYLLFFGGTSADCGWNNVAGHFDTYDEAYKAWAEAKPILNKPHNPKLWFHIVDLESAERVITGHFDCDGDWEEWHG